MCALVRLVGSRAVCSICRCPFLIRPRQVKHDEDDDDDHEDNDDDDDDDESTSVGFFRGKFPQCPWAKPCFFQLKTAKNENILTFGERCCNTKGIRQFCYIRSHDFLFFFLSRFNIFTNSESAYLAFDAISFSCSKSKT